MDTATIEKFISEKCIGYSEDFKRSYFEAKVRTKNGEIKTVYSYSLTLENESVQILDFSESRPYIANPQT